MIYFQILSVFFLIILSERIFRLKHPTKDLYVGGDINKPKYVKFEKSFLFSEEQSDISGYVRITIEDKKPKKVWRVTKDKHKLLFSAPSADKYDSFKAEFLSRDKVLIKSVIKDKCLQYEKIKKKFVLKKCGKGKKRQNQTFLITNEAGEWKGDKAKNSDATKKENKVIWGLCSACLIGGFGSDHQGNIHDIANGVSISDSDDGKSKHPSNNPT
ncbi:hypothetical protein M153_9650000638, partial [Pseudoloma neurophilia]